MPRRLRHFGFVPLLLAAAEVGSGQVCDPAWLPGSGFPGIDNDGEVLSLCVLDPDGRGPQPGVLVVGGHINRAGSAAARGVAMWDGFSWAELGAETAAEGNVYSLAAVDPDGDGPAPPEIVAGGEWSANNVVIRRWDGASWSDMASTASGNQTVYALAEFDPDGDGPLPGSLIAAGRFSELGAGPLGSIARWDGAAWQPLGSGLDGPAVYVNALTVFDADGPGPVLPVLIAAGTFTTAGGKPAASIAAWNGENWSPLDTGIDGNVYALAVHDPDGPCGAAPPILVAAGDFRLPEDFAVKNVAQWNGTNWSGIGTTLFAEVLSACSFDEDGDGPLPSQLLISGTNIDKGIDAITRWDGSQWVDYGFGPGGAYIAAMIQIDPDGDGPRNPGLVVGGSFFTAGEAAVSQVALRTGSQWSSLGRGTNGGVYAAVLYDPDGPGAQAAMLAGAGRFSCIGGAQAQQIALWDGISWTALGSGLTADGYQPNAYAVTVYDPDGPGLAPATLIAGGNFTYAGGAPANCIASWDGASWQPLGTGVSNTVTALQVYDADGAGPGLPRLIAGGVFTHAGGVPASNIAQWNGSSWQPMGAGANQVVEALTAFDSDGPGPVQPWLVAGGQFTMIGGVPAGRIARWNGGSWALLGGGAPNARVSALGTFDPDGAGPLAEDLIVGGDFTSLGSVSARGIGRWAANQWFALGSGVDGPVVAFGTFDADGAGPQAARLIVCGGFQSAGGVPTGSVAEWDGATWQALGTGTVGYASVALPFDPDGSGPALARLFIGNLIGAGGQLTAGYALWGRDTALWGVAGAGSWASNTNWACGAAPTRFDRVTIDAAAAGYSPGAVQIVLPTGVDPLEVRGITARTDSVTLDLSGRSLLLGSGAAGPDDPGILVDAAGAEPLVLSVRNSLAGSQADAIASAVSIAAHSGPSAALNELSIDDTGARLVVSGPVSVGRAFGEGRLTVRNEAEAVVHGGLTVGERPGSTGLVRVLGAGATLAHSDAGGTVDIGLAGSGEFRIGGNGPGEPGAQAYSLAPLASLSIGTGNGAAGAAAVIGPGSSWTVQSEDFFIGYSGSAVLRVEAGAAMTTSTDDELAIAANAASSGLAVVTDPGSTWIENTIPLVVNSGGALQVNNGGLFTGPGVEINAGGLLAGNSVVNITLADGVVRNVGAIAPSSGAEDASGVGTLSILGDLVMCDVVCSPPGACCTISGCADTTGQACFDVGGVFHPGKTCATCPCADPDGLTHPQTGSLLIDLASASSRDQLTVSQGATLAGSLVVSNLNPAYVPSVGDTLPFLSAGSMTGAFGVALMPALPGGRFLIPAYTYEARSPGVSLYCASLSSDIDLGPSASTPVAGVPAGAVLADFDGDGDLDLAVSIPDPTNPGTSPGSVVILRNAGNTGPGGSWAGFTQAPSVTITVGVDPRGIAAGRFNADNAVDLAVTNFADGTVKVLTNLNDGTGQLSVTQTIAVGAGPVAVAAADLRNLGTADLAVANKLSNSVSVLNNTGAGAFALNATLGAGAAPVDIKAARLDADALPDLVTANSGDGTVGTYVQTPSGFALSTPHFYFAGEEPTSIEPGQIDNGKDMDVVVTNTGGGSMTFLMGDGAGGFQPGAQVPAGTAPTSVALADLDGDGDRDLAVVTLDASSQSVIRVFRNDLTGDQLSFTDIGDQFAGADPRLVRAGDVDANGRADLVAVNAGLGAARGTAALDRGGAPGRGAKPTRGVQPNITAALSRPPCPADLSGDRAVGTADLVLLLAHFGQSVLPGSGGDLTNDGFVNTGDLVLLLAAFGHACG